jgi:biofilm PGA synthesis protein PgaA
MSSPRAGRWWVGLTSALLFLAAGAAVGADGSARADAVAYAIRDAGRIEDTAQRSERLRDAAIAAARLADELQAGSALWQRVQADRLYALQLAGDSAGAAAVHDTLYAAGAEIPGHARLEAADALFAVGRDRDAERVLLASLRESPQQPMPLIRLAFGLEAAGRGDDAYRYALGWWQRHGDDNGVRDIDRLEAGLLLARLARWRQRPQRAQAQLDALRTQFGGHRLLLAEQAALHRDQARPRAALATLAGRDDANSREIAAQAWLDLGQPQRALAQAAAPVAGDIAQRADAQLRGRGQLLIGYANTRSPAIRSPSGSDETILRLAADSGRLAQHWRLGVNAAQLRADFQDARPEARYAGARLTRHVSGGEWALEAGTAFDDFLDERYLLLEGSVWLSDGLRFGLRAAHQDPEGPLQARASGIGIDSIAVSGTWRPSPIWRIDLGLGQSRFDDDNRRRFVTLGAEAQLHAASGHSTHGFVGTYAGRNSRDDAPYFNPARSTSLEAGLVHRFGARHATAQQLRPSLAYVRQDDFGGHVVPLLGYRIAWPGSGGEPFAEFTAAQPVYDGQRETRFAVTVGYLWGAR